ncbi:MAG: hypothetical protein LUD19_01745 [Clostridia bacterium]|nr:hypothetical protein [Clostridia bacterium]
MENKAKAQTFIGFCVRSRKISMGTGAVDCLKKDVYLILVCATASQNCMSLAKKFARRHGCPLMLCKNGLENDVHKSGCKIAAVRDKNLAAAICSNADENYQLISEA